MSNPCVNRWGLNTFWQHYWYSDSRYALLANQDRIFIQLVQTYLRYGSGLPVSLFWNKYWFKTSVEPKQLPLTKRYRIASFYDESTFSWQKYQARLEGNEFFQTRISILRLDSWLLLNLYWFQPDKRRRSRLPRIKPITYTEPVGTRSTSLSMFKKTRALVLESSLQGPQSANFYNF